MLCTVEFAEEEEVGVPHCDCRLIRRLAVMKTVTRNGDANQGLRYWGCSNYQVTFVKKRKQLNEIEEESCKFFRFNLLTVALSLVSILCRLT